MKKRKFILILSIVLLSPFISCGQNNNQEKIILEKLQGKKIILPSKDVERSLIGNLSSPLEKKNKILTLIDGDCSTCIEILKAWKSFMI